MRKHLPSFSDTSWRPTHERSATAAVRGATSSGLATDLLSGDTLDAGKVRLDPYQYRWLALKADRDRNLWATEGY